MIYSSGYHLENDQTLIQIHIPRTAGTSLRRLAERAIGKEKHLENYNGEIEYLSREQLAKYRMISGHFEYGIHKNYFDRHLYFSVVRNPIDRYISTYSEFLTNPSSKHHKIAAALNINEFLRFGMSADDPSLRNQFNNLQCRMICGEANFQAAREIIENEYLFVCDQSQIDVLAQLLNDVLNAPSIELPKFHQRNFKTEGQEEHFQLSLDSIALILEHDREDVLLHSYVEMAFNKLLERISYSTKHRSNNTNLSEEIPPSKLRFMGERADLFLHQADCLVDQALGMYGEHMPTAILDIGCGYGRFAYGLHRKKYTGSYDGFDILPQHISWLNENFKKKIGSEKYNFFFSNTYNARYNTEGLPLAEISLPYSSESFDCLMAISVFTHLYEEELVAYIRYLKKYLTPNGKFVVSFFIVPNDFSLDNQPSNTTFPLIKKVSEHAFIHSLEEPLKVIAYQEGFLLELFSSEGLIVERMMRGNWFDKRNGQEFQDWFVLINNSKN